ncbi:MAG TPA: hypothetical protein VFT50_13380 [Baekduia sp.]|nr:hypothetical protein [Baekduia sp.]
MLVARTLVLPCLLVVLALGAGTAAAQRPASGEVHPVKAVYGLTESIDIAWSGIVGGEVEYWMEPAGTPLEGYPHGSYHSDYEDSGHYALENPGPGTWEVHWSVLGEDGVYLGGRFTVRPPKVKRVSAGHYGCETTTTMGLTRSSMQFIAIRGHNRYTAMGRPGKFRYSRKKATLRFRSGPLKRRVAHFRPDKKPKTIVFLRRENERHGKPTIDVSDTTCYLGTE